MRICMRMRVHTVPASYFALHVLTLCGSMITLLMGKHSIWLTFNINYLQSRAVVLRQR